MKTAKEVAALERRLNEVIANNVHHALEGQKWRALYENGDPTEKWMVAARQLIHASSVQPSCGVYFLMAKGVVVYVGKSRNVAKRLAGHTSKEYDDVVMLNLPLSGLDYWEGIYIQMFKPAMNVGKTTSWSHGWNPDGTRSQQAAPVVTS